LGQTEAVRTVEVLKALEFESIASSFIRLYGPEDSTSWPVMTVASPWSSEDAHLTVYIFYLLVGSKGGD
jgi:hypothetical protein